MPFADNFLAGSIISMLIPVLLLIAITVWFAIDVTRLPGSDSSQATHAPGTVIDELPTEPPPGGTP